MSASSLLEDVTSLAGRAVALDREGNRNAASYFYRETAKLIDHLLAPPPQDSAHAQDSAAAASSVSLAAKAREYARRAQELTDAEEADAAAEESRTRRSAESSDLERAYFLLSEGLDEDEGGHKDEAVELYSEAVELCIRAKNSAADPELKTKLGKVAVQALERAEALKGIAAAAKPPASSPAPRRTAAAAAPAVVPPLGLLSLRDDDDAHAVKQPAATAGYSEEEKRVLARTSLINGREYMPFMTADLKERFAFPVPFSDRHGKLSLSPKQRSRFARWARPDDFIASPKVLELVSEYAVKQTVVSDCSFVASIAISAQYEKKFGKKLITSAIFPQNRAGQPVYNPCGKYMIKLRLNGVPRKVIVDDFLPLGQHGELLCSYSSNKSELWISLLEKAYMKVMGGYDFPGSNSNIDLYALTGWIPERISIKLDDPTFNRDALFKQLFGRFHKGDALATIATGEMSESAAERAGLVPTHAYAVLDVREVKGQRVLLIKNPWSHLRWRGNFSELDTAHWTDEMKRALNYDPASAANFDNGVFWIDFESLLNFFDVVYLNWKPGLFAHTYGLHQTWKAGVGPAKDMYNISANPQFSLELGAGAGAIWILLSRHITDIDDFRDNKEYITVLVYKADGKKVFYPFDPPPFIDGVRINSPHYLCKTVVQDSSPRRFTLVVAQYEKTATIHYTLRVYSSLPFSLRKIGDPYKHKQSVTHEWAGASAGGCANYPDSYEGNPRFQFGIDGGDAHALIELKGPKQFQLGFDLVCVVASNKDSAHYFRRKSSGSYRSGYVVLALTLTPGTYNLTPTTFRPGQEAPFILTVQASIPFKLARIQ